MECEKRGRIDRRKRENEYIERGSKGKKEEEER